MFVPILLGSESDKDHAQKIANVLAEFGIEYEIKVLSAHKVPEKLFAYVQENNQKEDICYVTIAGRSNGLSGCTSGSSVHPVVACPPFSDKSDYAVNIHSTLQMPSETPVLTVIDPVNCALCVAKIFGVKNEEVRKKIAERIAKVKASF